MVCSPLLWSLTETVPVNSLLDLDVVLPLNFLPEMAVGKVLLQSLALELEKVLLRAGRMKLKAANPGFPDIVPREGQTVEIWGVVTAAIKQMPR